MEFKIGDKVVFEDAALNDLFPRFYPKPGTVGRIVDRHYSSFIVQWARGSTSGDDKKIAHPSSLRIVSED